MKIVEFAKSHTYGGQRYIAGDKLELPDDRAAALDAAGVLRKPRKKDDAE